MFKPAFAALSQALPLTRASDETRVAMTPDRVRIETFSGLTVALALVPEAVAFAFIAGVNPLVGLYAAFIICLITSLFGGRPGMISGATGALAVVMVSLVATHGVQYLFAAVILMGILQVAAGVLQLGRFIRLVPHPVMLGFVNGLAIVIFLAQFEQFKITGADGAKEWIGGLPLAYMLGLVALTMVVIHVVPKITKMFRRRWPPFWWLPASSSHSTYRCRASAIWRRSAAACRSLRYRPFR